MQAWLRRTKDLGIISFSWYKNTFMTFRKHNWHRNEPGEQVASEKPIRFRQLVLRAMAEGVISRERAEELSPGIVSIDGKDERMAKAKKIVPVSARRADWGSSPGVFHRGAGCIIAIAKPNG